MCGIAGYIGKTEISEQALTTTIVAMKRRGPDYQNYKVFRCADKFIYLLHSRLSIIDLDPRSHQPFVRDKCTVIFNGEIYNYLEVREVLQRKGHRFVTNSDTEVLVAAYQQYGERCVDHFEGMWSFALFDEEQQKLFLSRDRFAEKPLYYLEDSSGLYFGSEVKFIQSLTQRRLKPNTDQVLRYLVYGYKTLYKGSDTFFKEVKELPYASWAVISSQGKLQTTSYWQPSFSPRPMSRQDAVEGIRERLIESLRIRLRSDVPLAFCLSGGIDSGSLVSIAAKKFGCKVKCYSILDKDERYDERENIEATLKDTGSVAHSIRLEPENSLSRLEQVIAYHDAPIATITYYVHSLLSEQIARDGFKVVFSGTASDELFTGYYDHFNLFLYEMRTHPLFDTHLKEWTQYIRPVVRNPILQNPYMYMDNPQERGHITLNSDEFRSYLKVDFSEPYTEQHFCDSLLRSRMLNEVFHEATRLILHEDDLNSMMFSLENRSPFLDRHLFEFAYAVPTEHLIHDGYGKSLLREAMQGILNDTVRLDRQKKGFNAAIHSVFNLSDATLREVVLDQGPIYDLIDRKKIKQVMDIPDLSNSFSKFLFSFINAKIFLEQHA